MCCRTEEAQPSKPITAITAICDSFGVIHTTFVLGSVDTLVFQDFLITLFGRLRELSNEPVIIVMDNVGFHNTEQIKAMITSSRHTHLATPPNSCELNPIEYIFHIWKSGVSIPNEITEIGGVIAHLDAAFRRIPVTQVRACIAHVTEVLFPRAALSQQLYLPQIVGALFPELPHIEEVGAQAVTDSDEESGSEDIDD